MPPPSSSRQPSLSRARDQILPYQMRYSTPGYFRGAAMRTILSRSSIHPAGRRSNYGGGRTANHVYLTATLDAATWGAELAVGEGPGRIYIVEPTGAVEDDPNVTDKKFPGNPTRSYRTRQPVRVVGELLNWVGHSPEQLRAMREHLDDLKRQGVEYIED